MKRIKEMVLNGFLILLVFTSILLSGFVWFPPEQATPRTKEARVQMAPPADQGSMPDIYRPERLYVKAHDRPQMALLPAGSAEYAEVWEILKRTLYRLPVSTMSELPASGSQKETDSVTMVLPVALRIADWADVWFWNQDRLINPTIIVDRIRFEVGDAPMLHLSGPLGREFRMGPLSPQLAAPIQEVLAKLDPKMFRKYRQPVVKDPLIRLAEGLLVPDVNQVPRVQAEVRKPDEQYEKARYFPDLSVVRQIDEKDARSFTDGQRLLRLTNAGLLEYRTVGPAGMPPELSRAIPIAQDWVNARGGWPQDLVLSQFRQQPGKAVMTFELRADGPYPIESHTGALQVEITGYRQDPSADTITFFRRYPDLRAYAFGPASDPIITPEKALDLAREEFPYVFLQDMVREMHLAYELQSTERGSKSEWKLGPAWVIQVGDLRLYVPASTTAEDESIQIRNP